MEVKRKYSVIGVFIAIVFVSLFVFFLKKGKEDVVARSRNKLTYAALEEHILDWLTDQLEQMRDVTDRLENDDSVLSKHKELILMGMAQQTADLLELMHPLHHDEECLVEWAKSFIADHPFIEDTW